MIRMILFWSSQNCGSTLAEYPSESSWANGLFHHPRVSIRPSKRPCGAKCMRNWPWQWSLGFWSLILFGSMVGNQLLPPVLPMNFWASKARPYAGMDRHGIFRVVGMVWWGEWLPTFHHTLYQNKACCESFLVAISKVWEFNLCDKSLASFGDEQLYRLNGVGNPIRVRVSAGFSFAAKDHIRHNYNMRFETLFSESRVNQNPKFY